MYRNRFCCKRKCHMVREHVHKFEGVTEFAECGKERHRHCFIGVSGEAIPCDCSHFHWIKTKTECADGHFHEICVRSGPAVIDPCSKCTKQHVHFVKGVTNFVDEHCHKVDFVTMIETPVDC